MENITSFSLGDLSSELIIKILHFCELPTILRFAITCKAYHELVAQSTSLQLHIELEAYGLEIIQGSSKPHATYSVILADLRQFQGAWLNLDLREPITRPVMDWGMIPRWELREGLFVKTRSRLGFIYPDSLEFFPLDSETQDLSPLIFDFTFEEFTVDPGQGLVALVSRTHQARKSQIYLCSLSTGLAHPFAQHPRIVVELDFEPPDMPFERCYDIEIMEKVVLMKISRPQEDIYELLIWNWKSGALLDRINSREGICDFTFLDQQHLAVLSATRLNQDSLTLQIYSISYDTPAHNDTSNSQLWVARLSVSQPILCLGFPQLKESSQISEGGFILRSDPTPGRTLYRNSAAFACLHAITLSISFSFRSIKGNNPLFHRVFLDGKYLLDLIHASPRSATRVLPWSLWGENISRWFVAPKAPYYWLDVCWMSGSRYIFMPPLSDFCVIDFSPKTVGRFRDQLAPSRLFPAAFSHSIDKHVHDLIGEEFKDMQHLNNYLRDTLSDLPSNQPIVITVGSDNPSAIDPADGSGLDEQVISRLPYRLVCKGNDKNKGEVYHWQINGNCVIGVSSWGFPDPTIIYKLNK